MSDEEISPRSRGRPDSGGQAESLERQISALTEVIGSLASKVNKLRDRVEALENGGSDEDAQDQPDTRTDRPAPWVVFTPPAAAEDRQYRKDGHGPDWTLDNFVAWFNVFYVGVPGGPAKAIPRCWRDHRGLPAEVATLAYSWRRANIGTTANVRDAQYWHHTWRPGFATRLNDWVHPHCLDGRHRDVTGTPVRSAAGAAEHRTD